MVEIRRTSSSRRRQIADHFTEQVAKKEALRLRGLRHKDETVWFGLGMMGIVGWAVAIPTLVFIAIGLWIDRAWPVPVFMGIDVLDCRRHCRLHQCGLLGEKSTQQNY